MSDHATTDVRRLLPAIDRLLGEAAIAPLVGLYGRERVLIQARAQLADLRLELAADPRPDRVAAAVATLPDRLASALAAEAGAPLARVLNATGVFLHTNLGRAPLPRAVAAASPALLDAACDLEMDLATGKRHSREARAVRLLVALTGAESALVVNNNAAAMALALAALAAGREVVVSRGELVEIGGGFRIPEILAAAGARLVEVGTTNRTRLADYAAAIGAATALLLKVFPSNYRQVGFVATVEPEALAELAHRHGVALLVDEGSGLLRPHPAPQLAAHPAHQTLIARGCDLVCGSGDKLLGGPQAGLLLGRRELVERCRRHPLYRAFRPGRETFALLEPVLRRHLAGAPLPLDGLWPDPAVHRERLLRVGTAIGAEVVAADAFLGGGSAPEAPIPGEALALPGSDALARRLRQGEPAVVGYLRDGRLILDLRTVDAADDAELIAAVGRALRPG